MPGALCIWGGCLGGGQEVQGGGKVASVLDNMDVLAGGFQLIRMDRGQTAADYDGLGAVLLSLVDEVPALGGGRVRDAARVDDDQFRPLRHGHLRKPIAFEKLANLLRLVLIDLA